MNSLLEWIGKIFGHLNVSGVEKMAIKGVQALLVLVASYLVSRVIQRIIDRSVKDDSRTYKVFVRNCIMISGIFIALHVMGLNLSTLFHTGGLFAIAAVFALKNIVNNLISGYILRSEGVIKPGDVLETNGAMMEIERIGLRGVVTRIKDSKSILVPSS